LIEGIISQNIAFHLLRTLLTVLINLWIFKLWKKRWSWENKTVTYLLWQ